MALAINGVAGYLAALRGSVSASGAIAGTIVGALILFCGGFAFWLMLMLFFVSSSVLTRVGGSTKEELERVHEKGARRDAMQVVANGGVAAAVLLAYRISGEPVLLVCAAASLASANADTWSSEVGVLARRPPRSIVTFRTLERGVSGGVSVPGTLAGAAGSMLIALWFAAVSAIGIWPATPPATAAIAPSLTLPAALAIVGLAGFVGMILDSILGASIQAQYRAPDGRVTEQARTDGAENALVRGVRFVTNDVVNLAAAAFAAVLAGVLAA